jgi:hypothetical protein
MSKRGCLVVGLVWVLSLVVVTAGSRLQSSHRSIAAAQATRYQPFPEPRVMSGEDVGFRVEGMQGDQPAGAIVIRVNGKWVEARLAPVIGTGVGR